MHSAFVIDAQSDDEQRTKKVEFFSEEVGSQSLLSPQYTQERRLRVSPASMRSSPSGRQRVRYTSRGRRDDIEEPRAAYKRSDDGTRGRVGITSRRPSDQRSFRPRCPDRADARRSEGNVVRSSTSTERGRVSLGRLQPPHLAVVGDRWPRQRRHNAKQHQQLMRPMSV